jgi:hypothetical protein
MKTEDKFIREKMADQAVRISAGTVEAESAHEAREIAIRSHSYADDDRYFLVRATAELKK